MLIERGQEIAGLEAIEARRLMRELLQYSMTPAAIAAAAGLDPASQDLHRTLVTAGLIQVDDRPTRTRQVPGVDTGPSYNLAFWGLTIAGTALAKARIGKPMKRAKADALVAELLSRIEEINVDVDSPFDIISVDVFGSYVDPARGDVGDVDLRVLYRPRPGVDLEAVNKVAVARAHEADRTLTSFDHFGWLIERDLHSRVRGRSNRLDIQFDRDQARPLPDGAVVVQIWPR